MACESPECHVNTPLPPSHSGRPSPLSVSQSSQRNPKEDQCFNCKRIGHWSRDCPEKLSRRGSAPSFSENGSDLPLVRCPCGRGACKIITSHTDKNPGRKFYTCPGRSPGNKCDFFEWFDVIGAKPKYKPPTCPCGAGKCSLNKESGGPDRGRWYFACRIKKSHGACRFFQWTDSEVENLLETHAEKSKGNSAPHSLFHNHHELVENNELCKEHYQNSDLDHSELSIVDSFETDETTASDLVMQDAESWDPAAEKRLQFLIPESEIHGLETEFSCQVSAPKHTTNEEVACDIEGPSLSSDSSSNDESDLSLGPQSSWECVEHPNSVSHEPSGTATMVQKNDRSRSALKIYGQGLLESLQSMDETQHETMLKVAEATFDTLRHLSVDCETFSKAVKEYIHCKSRFAGLKRSVDKDLSSEELLAHYDDKKTQFDSVSQLHLEAVSAYKASENRLESHRGEVEHAKNVLLQLEKQLTFCEIETFKYKTRVTEISRDQSESEKNLDDICKKMEEAFKLEAEQDSISDAEKAALENAKVQLQL